MVSLILATISYLVSFISQVALIAFIAGFNVFGNNINAIGSNSISAILLNIFLVIIFALQHSVMARVWFKNILQKFIPQHLIRAFYVLLSSIALYLIVIFWQPLNGFVWKVENSFSYILWGIFLAGWTFSLIATFIINHFDLFGLQDAWDFYKKREKAKIEFKEKLFYKYIRHPIQLGVIIGIWATPVMSYSHFLLSILFTIYILVGIYYEEKDLEKEFGDIYIEYKKRVGKLFPKFNKLF